MKSQIGEFRFHVVVQRCTNVKGKDGAVTKEWAERTSLWCDINTLSSTETLDGRQVSGEATHILRMRYESTLLLSDRIVHGSRYFYITSIANVDNRDRFMLVTVKESQA